MGFRGEAAWVKVLLQRPSLHCAREQVREKCKVFRRIHESGLADPVTSDCRCTVLDPPNFWSIPAFPHLSEPPAQILPSPTHTLTHFIKHQPHVFFPLKPRCTHWWCNLFSVWRQNYLTLLLGPNLDLKAALVRKHRYGRYRLYSWTFNYTMLWFFHWSVISEEFLHKHS